jgi:hypothetical protein
VSQWNLYVHDGDDYGRTFLSSAQQPRSTDHVVNIRDGMAF